MTKTTVLGHGDIGAGSASVQRVFPDEDGAAADMV